MKRLRKDLSSFKKDLAELMENDFPSGAENEIFHEMLFNIGKLREEKLDVLELRLLNTAFAELRYALKVFKPYRSVPKAAVFGSARLPKDHEDFMLAENFGKKLAKKGWMLITGGASGIMEAAMIGAGAKHSFGLNIMLPFEQRPNETIRGNAKLIYFKYFFTRKLMFLKESQATVLFPGGFGTFDEGFESFTLVQTGKARPRPLVFVDTPQSVFWKSLVSFIKKNMGAGGLISPHDLSILRIASSVDESVEELETFYRNYQSARFVGDRLILRLKRAPDGPTLERLNRDFADLLGHGAFKVIPPTLAEIRDNDDLDCERLAFYPVHAYGRLRELVDELNRL